MSPSGASSPLVGVSFFRPPQLTPHLRIASFAVLLMACLSRDLSVWKKFDVGLIGRVFTEDWAGLFDLNDDNSDSVGPLVDVVALRASDEDDCEC